MVKRILDYIGWLGFALVLVAVAIRFGVPAKDQYAPYFAYAGLVCVLLYALGQWREIASLFSRRQARYGGVAAVSILVVLGILVAINYIGARQNKRWDLTASGQFSLSDQTRNVVSKLEAPLHIMVFAKDQDFQRYRDRLDEYEYLSKKITTEYVDPDRKPQVANQFGIQQYGTILFQYMGRSERVTADTEQDITGGIIKVVSGQQRKVYFTQGHGEKDTTSMERDGYNQIAAALGHENYTVDKVVLAQTGMVPDDAAAIIVAGPKMDFLPAEIDALKKYLAKAGKVLLELDPPDTPDSPKLTNLIALAHDWGVDVGQNVVVDGSGIGRLIGTDATVPVVASYPPHPINQRFNYMTAYPLTRSVTPVSGGVNGRTAQPFAETSQRSAAVKGDVKSMVTLLTSSNGSLDPSKVDKNGPVSIAVAVSAPVAAAGSAEPADAPKPETRVVVIGDSDFAANNFLGVQGNRDFFMNMVGWLTQQENLISIRPKEAGDRRLTMTASQQTNLLVLSLLVIPGFIFGTGVYTWWRRR